jgi:phosphoribosylanthranilate isomerase
MYGLDCRALAPHAKQLRGTGRTHDWSISRHIRETTKTPVILAGGLHAANVAEAIRTVRPVAVDVCTGVRTDGRLDETKLRAFVASVLAA